MKKGFGKVNIKGLDVSIEVDFSNLEKKLNHAQKVLDAQVWADMVKYMPLDSSNLIKQTQQLNEVIRERGGGKVYAYNPVVAYAHYQWEGRTMVDSVTGSSWARKGASKVYVGEYDGDTNAKEYLDYSQNKPIAQRHWNEVAVRNHKKEWVKVVKRSFRDDG